MKPQGSAQQTAEHAHGRAAGPPPNVLYLHCHDLGRHCSAYGHPVPTPALEALAAGGVTYRNAFCVSPTCSPSRAALLTGQPPHRCGQWGLSNRGDPLRRVDHHLAGFLGDAGYRTALLGVQHVVGHEAELPYDHIAPEAVGYAVGEKEAENLAAPVADRAVAWLEEHGRGDAPWFLDAGTLETHTGAWRFLGDDEPDQAEVDRTRPPLLVPDTPGARRWYARHRAMARRMDAAVGRVLAALDRLGLAETTLVVFTTDHGIGLPTAKCNLTDAGLEVSLILRGPGFRGGHTRWPVVTHLDVFPTVCAAAGLTPPAWLEGSPLQALEAPGAGTGPEALHKATFGEVNRHGGPQPSRSVRTGRHKLIRRWHGPEELAFNTDGRDTKAEMLAAGWPQRMPAGRPGPGGSTDLLFDLALDPTERRDLSGDPGSAATLARLRGLLQRRMQRTDDPLLRGPDALPAPRGRTPASPDAAPAPVAAHA